MSGGVRQRDTVSRSGVGVMSYHLLTIVLGYIRQARDMAGVTSLNRLHDAWPHDALTLAPRDPWTRSAGVERWGRETVTCANSWHANGHAIALELACQPP